MKTNNLSIFLLVVVLLSPITASAQIAAGGGFSVERSVIANGGGSSSNGAFSVNGTAGQNAAGAKPINGAFSHQSGFWVNDQFSPTAAGVSISGKVKTANGQGIRNARITLIAENGSTRSTVTGSFGLFQFTDVEAGHTYVLSVASKRFVFANPSQVISAMEDLTEIEFISQD